jgi:hypothetical protein
MLPTRQLHDGQLTNVWVADLGGSVTLVHADAWLLLEAPNWTHDGSALLLNGDGRRGKLDLQADRRLTVVG